MHPIPNVNKYTAVTNLQIPTLYLNWNRVEIYWCAVMFWRS